MASYRQDLYPFAGSRLDLDGLSLHYLDEGSGEPVIMLHGNPTWSFFYRNLVLGLRGQYRAIVPDHMGCGLSDKPGDERYEYSLARRVEDLESLLAHLRIEGRVTLVLHDWGGMIGMAWAARHPERVARLVLLNTAAFHLPSTRRLPPSLWMCRNTKLDDFLIRRSGLFCRLVTRWGCFRPLPDRVRDGYLSPHNSGERRLAHLRFVQDIPLQPGDRSYARVSEVQERLPSFRQTPTLILWGEKDFVFDRHFLAVWQQTLPEAEIHRFPNAGHLVLEDAGDEILPLIRQFLARHPVESPRV
ncbi:MAG: alpha/beta fold hydrolase [Limisphaerales bacterium]